VPTHRMAVIIVGILFIAATAANLISTSLTRSLFTAPDYLKSLSASGQQVLVGALFALIAAFASASIAIALYPVLRRYNEGLALGSLGFRLMEAVFYIVDIIGLLSLVALSQAFVKAGAPVIRTSKPSARLYKQIVSGRTLCAESARLALGR
jgi:hydrogenase-4 membrane subunit HyfE